jgi:transposase-like protein
METKTIDFPGTLIEAIRKFSDLDYATAFFASIRWPHGVCCPHCGSVAADYLPKRRLWQCREKHDRNQFSVKIGTVFEECRLPIDKCLVAVWLEVNAKNSISSCELARAIGVTQKTAWFLLHRVRAALHQGHFEKLAGTVEADETFVGGLAKNMHKAERARKITGTGGSNKTAVMGLLARHDGKRHSTVRTRVLPNMQHDTVRTVVNENVAQGSTVYTDAFQAYRTIGPEYFHDFVDHTEAYVRGAVHTNGLENFWALFKRCIKGTHISVEPFHLGAYVDSEAYRFNNRETDDAARFVGALKGTPGKRLTYKTLIGDAEGYTASDSEGEIAN